MNTDIGQAKVGPQITRTDVTNLIARLAKEAVSVIHDLEKLPPQLLAGVVQNALKILGNRGFSFEENGQATTVSGTKIIEYLQSLGIPAGKIALTIYALATNNSKTPGLDNLVHMTVSELKNTIIENPHLNNSFYAKCQKCQQQKSLAPLFKRQPDPLAAMEFIAKNNGTAQIDITPQKTPAQKIEIRNLAKFCKLASDALGITPETAARGAKQLTMLGAA